jgi:hypothetical protein
MRVPSELATNDVAKMCCFKPKVSTLHAERHHQEDWVVLCNAQHEKIIDVIITRDY